MRYKRSILRWIEERKNEAKPTLTKNELHPNPSERLNAELKADRIQQWAGIAMFAIVVVSVLLLNLPSGLSRYAASISSKSNNSTSVLSGKKIIIDAGHGGFDPGAIGIEGVKEAPLNLSVAQYLEAELVSRGVTVELTRSNSEALADEKNADMRVRSTRFEQSNADAGVSIHMNKFEQSNVSGPMVFFYPNSEEGQRMAQAVQDALDEGLERSKAREAKSANYFILRESKTISILVECGFISNPDDVWLLQQESHQQKLARAIADGLERYFSSEQNS